MRIDQIEDLLDIRLTDPRLRRRTVKLTVSGSRRARRFRTRLTVLAIVRLYGRNPQ